MTKRRPSNKKPTGLNRSLGNSLLNEKERSRRSHQRAKFDGDIENPAFLEKDEKKVIDSVTEESGLEEFLAKAELAGTEFTADRESLRIVESNSAVVIPSKKDFLNNLELQKEYESRLRIPRRPSKELWNDVEELNRLENEVFLKWREDLADLQEVDGLALTPFERNPEMWKELWRVVERSDIVVQIVDARNPLLFRSKDLENYVKEVDPAKQNLLLVNKSDLLEPDHLVQWESYFKQEGVEVIFWSAVEELEKIAEDEDGTTDEPEPSCSHEISEKFKVIRQKEELIRYVKQIGGIEGIPGEKQLVVGMVGYPNVGKSSTINKLVGAKKVSVSATPGKTRHFQTIHIDKELCLCDCPGLVMPSFTFGRNEMFLNGIMPVDQMREHFGPTALLLSRIPTSYIEEQYSVMLPDRESPSAVDLLTTLAFMRGFMSSAGIPDCSRAARMLIKDVVTGKIMWVAAPPGTDQHTFDHVLYHTEDQGKKSGGVQLKQLEKRGLLEGDSALNSKVDSLFFDGRLAGAHVRTAKTGANTDANASVATSCIPLIEETKGSKKHFNGRKKEKLRRIYVGSYA